MTSNPTEALETEIEQVVLKHLAAQRAIAVVALERAFRANADEPGRSGAKRRSRNRRRPPSEVAALAERLYEAVCAHAGETMAVIAPQVGESARALSRPMTHLKRAGRVRSAGQRGMTRYFPLSS